MTHTPQDTAFWQTRPATDEHKDWLYEGDWITGYEKSVEHPHRAVIIQIMKNLVFPKNPFIRSLLEIGCSVGPNLRVIHDAFPRIALTGIDPNKESVDRAQTFCDGIATVREGDVRHLMVDGYEADIILADASLMYITPEEIKSVMDQIAIAAKKAVIIVERVSGSTEGEPTGGVWGRDYVTLLKERGFKVRTVTMTEEMWPGSPNWAKYGQYIVGTKE